MEFILSQAVFLPLLLSPLAYILGRKLGTNAAMWFTFGLLLYCTINNNNSSNIRWYI